MRMTAECCCWRPLNSLDEKWKMSVPRERKTLTWAAAALQLCGQRTKLSLTIAKLLAIARLCCLVQVYKFIIHLELKSFSREYCALVWWDMLNIIVQLFQISFLFFTFVWALLEVHTTPKVAALFLQWKALCRGVQQVIQYAMNTKIIWTIDSESLKIVYIRTLLSHAAWKLRKWVEQRRKVGSAHSQPTFYHPARLLLPHNNGKSLQIPLENWTSSSLWSL